MGLMGVVLALALPWLTGALCVFAALPKGARGARTTSLGLGYVLGMLATAALLGFSGALWSSLTPWLVLLMLVLLASGALVVCRRRGRLTSIVANRVGSHETSEPGWHRLATFAVLGWLALRWGLLAIEQWSQGLYGWDAWSTWAYRARVWVEAGHLVSFVSPEIWLASPANELAASPAAHYPLLASLLMAWPVLLCGGWNESAALAPWLMLFPALALGFYGMSRLWGADRLTAAVFMGLLLSLPLLNNQIALAGYVDVWLATCVGFGFMAFLLWMRDGEIVHGAFAALFIVAGIFLKSEGLVWAALFMPALLTRWIGARGWIGVAVAGAAVVGLLAWSGGVIFDLPGVGRFELSLDRVSSPMTGTFEFLAQEGVLRPLLIHLFVFGTWHLLPWLMLGGLVYSAVKRFSRGDDQQPRVETAALVWVLASLVGFYLLFFWTSAAEWVRLGTSVNRILLHFTPAWMFWLLSMWQSRDESVESGR